MEDKKEEIDREIVNQGRQKFLIKKCIKKYTQNSEVGSDLSQKGDAKINHDKIRNRLNLNTAIVKFEQDK